MDTDLAELSSISSSIDQLTRRVTGLVDVAVAGKHDDVAVELMAVERALAGAGRRLERLVLKRPGGAR